MREEAQKMAQILAPMEVVDDDALEYLAGLLVKVFLDNKKYEHGGSG